MGMSNDVSLSLVRLAQGQPCKGNLLAAGSRKTIGKVIKVEEVSDGFLEEHQGRKVFTHQQVCPTCQRL